MSAGGIDIATLVEVMVASGLLTAVTETVRWLTAGRGRQRVDNAKIVQGMAIDLVQPLHTELDACRARLADLASELDAVLAYALICHALLEQPEVRRTVEQEGRKVPVPPAAVVHKQGGAA